MKSRLISCINNLTIVAFIPQTLGNSQSEDGAAFSAECVAASVLIYQCDRTPSPLSAGSFGISLILLAVS